MDWHQLWEIVSTPDNVPIVALLFLVPFFAWLAWQQARANDQLIAASRGTGYSPEVISPSRSSRARLPRPVVAASSTFQIVSIRPAPTIRATSSRWILRRSPT